MADQSILAGLTRLEKRWLKTRVCSFCEVYLTAKHCGGYSGLHTLPIIEGVRDKEKVVNLGPACNMAERRVVALASYKPRTSKGDE